MQVRVEDPAEEGIVGQVGPIDQPGQGRQRLGDRFIIVDRAGGLGDDQLVLIAEKAGDAGVFHPPQRDDCCQARLHGWVAGGGDELGGILHPTIPSTDARRMYGSSG